MKIFKVFFTLLIFFLITSCEKVIDVDLKTAEPKLVIDASINWQKNTTGNLQKIKLSTTTSYYSNTFPVFSGAEVTVTNSANNVFKFIENAGTGVYAVSYTHLDVYKRQLFLLVNTNTKILPLPIMESETSIRFLPIIT